MRYVVVVVVVVVVFSGVRWGRESLIDVRFAGVL